MEFNRPTTRRSEPQAHHMSATEEEANPMSNAKAIQVNSFLFPSYIFILREYEPCVCFNTGKEEDKDQDKPL